MICLLLISTVLNTQSFYIDEKVTCDIHVEQSADFEAFLQNKQAQKLSSFTILSSSLSGTTLRFVLEPTKTGTLIFAPGFITLLPQKQQKLLPAVKAICKSTGLTTLSYMPLLSLYPEKKITLSEENRLRLPQELESDKIVRYKKAWALLVAILVTFAGSFLFVWALIEYELARRAKQWLLPKKDPIHALWDKVNSDIDLKERWQSLVLLIERQISQTKLHDVMKRAELILYANSPTSIEEFEKAKKKVARTLKPSRNDVSAT